MMCDTSLIHAANGPRIFVHRAADGRSGRTETLLTCGNEETTKVIGKP